MKWSQLFRGDFAERKPLITTLLLGALSIFAAAVLFVPELNAKRIGEYQIAQVEIDGTITWTPIPGCPSPPDGYQLKDPGIASGSLCRGACGADCDPDACTGRGDFTICVASPTKHRICTYTGNLNCGSHPACVVHDNCYDSCVGPVYPGQPDHATCRRICDLECVNKHGLENCAQWATGGGPQTQFIRFTSAPIVGPVMEGPCPPIEP